MEKSDLGSVMDSDKKDILKYVSNTDKDIYSVSNLPEEVIAVIFAYVSRSPKSFRENIKKVTEEKASKFHEKWVLNFGHSSVSELATAHICVENVSRLFSSILERANLFISPIEYSQRYQRPKRGAYYRPPILDKYPELKREYEDFNNSCYDVYEKLNEKLLEHHKKLSIKPENTDEKTYRAALEKIAFEDARYVLPLSVYTNLGITANGRALENLIMKLLSNKYYEVRTRGKEIKKEALKVLPTLVKYADENDYIKNFYNKKICDYDIPTQSTLENVKLIHCNEKSEKKAFIKLLAPIIAMQNGDSQIMTEKHLETFTISELNALFKKSLKAFGTYDEPQENFHQITYTFELLISEACWHQLLRHRKTHFYDSSPDVKNGITIPPLIKQAELESMLLEVSEKSKYLYYKLLETSGKQLNDNDEHKSQSIEEIASYVVLNAHKRRITASIDLWELYNIINLRLTSHAQWDIKNIVNNICAEIKKIHPNLLNPALFRVKNKA